MYNIFDTDNSLAPLIARISLGVVILPHGLQKLLGIWGGKGFLITMENFQATGLPFLVGFIIICAESFGAFFLILGFLSRISALFISAIMVGAILKVHGKFGFFMNWSGKQAGEGFEFHLLAIALSVIVLLYGGGKWALDSIINRYINSKKEHTDKAGDLPV